MVLQTPSVLFLCFLSLRSDKDRFGREYLTAILATQGSTHIGNMKPVDTYNVPKEDITEAI